MNCAGISLITEDVPRLARFYEAALGVAAEGDETHTVLPLEGAGLVLYDRQAAQNDMGFDFSAYDGTGRLILSFDVADVDADYARLKALGTQFVHPPKTWPWGARSMHFRDPDGNIVGFRTLPGARA